MLLLDKNHYPVAVNTVSSVGVNHIFARVVLENHVSGKVYTDNNESPSAFHVVHPYGMSLLFGSPGDTQFLKSVTDYMLNKNGERQNVEWMQAYPGKWNELIGNEIGDSFAKPGQACAPCTLEIHTRANFRFNIGKYRPYRVAIHNAEISMERTNQDLYEKMNGTVVPMNFWDSAEDFCKKGIGFSLVINNEPVCTAYSAYMLEKQLEIGIETRADFRGKGYALYACSALIDYCLENNYEPVWSCRLENTPSYQLAQKLGFEPTMTLPYYRLPV